jgi:hypothetical protein
LKVTVQCSGVDSSNHLRKTNMAPERSVVMINPLPQFVLDAIERVRLGIDDPEMRERFRRRFLS